MNTAHIWVAEEPGADRYFLFDESLEGGLSTMEHAQRARDRAMGRKLVSAWDGAGSEEH